MGGWGMGGVWRCSSLLAFVQAPFANQISNPTLVPPPLSPPLCASPPFYSPPASYPPPLCTLHPLVPPSPMYPPPLCTRTEGSSIMQHRSKVHGMKGIGVPPCSAKHKTPTTAASNSRGTICIAKKGGSEEIGTSNSAGGASNGVPPKKLSICGGVCVW